MPIRDYALTVLPPWLLDAHGTAWAQAHGDVKDALAALLKERVAARMPIRPGASDLAPYAPPGALEALGRDRLMPRAVGEGYPEYAARLAGAWEAHANAGTPMGALLALKRAGYPEAMMVIRSRRLYRLNEAEELVVQELPPGSWCYEPEPQPFWSRYSILFSHPNLPPAWTETTTRTLSPRQDVRKRGTVPGFVTLSAVRPVAFASGRPPPVVSLTGSPVPEELRGKTVSLVVPDPQTAYDFTWATTSGGLGDDEQPMFSAGNGPVTLQDNYAGNGDTGIRVQWGFDVVAGSRWEFDVIYTPPSYVNSPPPTLTQTGPLAFTGPVVLSVVTGSPSYTFRYSVAGSTLRTVNMNPGAAVPLLLADNSPSGLSVMWTAMLNHYPEAEWHWHVYDVPAVPAEESVEMNLIRTLTKEWSNAAAVFEGIFIVTHGRALGWPLAPLGSGWKLGGSRVLKYHP